MHSYLIYQRPMDKQFQDELNGSELTPKKKAYFDLHMMPDGNAAEVAVENAICHDLYKPTMLMIGHAKPSRSTLECIFAEGNGHGTGEIDSHSLMKHSSISVGDLVVSLDNNTTHVCMPMGWHEVCNITLNLNIGE